MMGRFDFEKPSMSTSMTLPRLSDAGATKTKQQPKKPTRLDISAPRAMSTHTLPPPRLANLSTSPAEADTNPLRILRDKNYPIVRPRIKCTVPLLPPPPISAAREPIDHSDQDGICESPSYLTQAECSFNDGPIDVSNNREIENLNPIPLPPRDRNKPMPLNVKRHVRKYPLIIPATGLQRTLNKVVTPVEEKEAPTFPNVYAPPTPSSPHSHNQQQRHSSPYKQDIHYARRFIENNFPDHPDRTYENMESMRGGFEMQTDCTDSASLHFESILEDGDCNVADVMASPDVTGDFMFEINKEHKLIDKGKSLSTGEDADEILGNLDIEQKKLAFSQRHPKYVQPQNELANNIMFNKLKEAAESTAVTEVSGRSIRGRILPSVPLSVDEVDGAVGGTVNDDDENDDEDDVGSPGILQHSNSVSCEDLLEFSDQKPKGRERGVESDEVRIMTKVLGSSVSATVSLVIK